MKRALETIAYIASIALLYAILFYAGSARASDTEVYYEGKNELGQIVALFDRRPPECGGYRLMIAFSNTGEPFPGCWENHERTKKVVIQYGDGLVRVYEQWEFQRKTYSPANMRRRYQ